MTRHQQTLPILAALGIAVLYLLVPAAAQPVAETPAAQSAPTATAPRPAEWAAPLPKDGAPNLHRVTPKLYRSAQPTSEGFKALEQDPGIRTVVSLRAFNSDKELLIGTGINLVSVPIHTWDIDTEDVVRALAAIRVGETQGPVLLHCQHGADRTGLISALYRVLYQGWTKDAALAEMRKGDFGYHAVWGNIPRYLRKVNVEALRRLVDKAVR